MGKVLVLGGGRQGSFIGKKLSKEGHEVVIWDIREELRGPFEEAGIKFERKNLFLLQEPEKELAPYHVIIDALPGSIGFKALEKLVALGKRVVSISFGSEDYLLLSERAEKTGALVIPDAGIAPGLTNMLAGYGFYKMGRAESLKIWIGGIPNEPLPPFYHNITWSAEDLIDEYTRPARLKEYGILKTVIPLNNIQSEMNFPVKPLSSFPTDGLRSLLYTLPIPNMEERTLRYAQHLQAMKTIYSFGFFDENLTVDFAGISIPIKSVTEKVFKERFSFFPQEDLLIGRVVIKGEKTISFKIYGEYDYERKITAMSRGTGTVASCLATMLMEGMIKVRGVYPPENLGKHPEIVNRVIKDLAREGIGIRPE